jgi:hypothetical protein
MSSNKNRNVRSAVNDHQRIKHISRRVKACGLNLSADEVYRIGNE